ncbi:MAG: hypothetical protein AAF449_13530 [Myxococcota bacterium]
MKLWLGIGVGVLGLLGASCAVECETNRDCPSGQFQCRDNRCVLPERDPLPDVGNIPFIDVGFPDVPDAGFIDLGILPDTGGLPRDTGVVRRDAGFPDTGARDAGDSGVMTGELNDTEALVQVGLLRTSADGLAVVGQARFIDYSASGRDLRVRQQDGCTVTERPMATGVPIDARRIDVSGDTSFQLTRSGPGLFDIQTQGDPQELIRQGNTVRYSLLSTGASGTLVQTSAQTGSPASTQTAVVDPEAITGFNALPLLPQASEGANVAEIYDEDRRVVAVCPIMQNTLALPPGVASAFVSGTVVFAEIRSDAETTIQVTVRDRGMIPVTFRTTRGVRYRLRIP